VQGPAQPGPQPFAGGVLRPGVGHGLPFDGGLRVPAAIFRRGRFFNDPVRSRRVLDSVTSRHLHIGELHIDTAARTVDAAGRAVALSRLEFELLCQLASDPKRVFAKGELMHAVWATPRPSAHARSTATPAACAASSTATATATPRTSPTAGGRASWIRCSARARDAPERWPKTTGESIRT